MIFLLETFWGYMLDLRLCNPLPSTMHPAPGETMRRVYDCGALPRSDISLCQKKNGKICPIWQSDEEFSPKLTVYDSSGDLIWFEQPHWDFERISSTEIGRTIYQLMVIWCESHDQPWNFGGPCFQAKPTQVLRFFADWYPFLQCVFLAMMVHTWQVHCSRRWTHPFRCFDEFTWIHHIH